MLGYPKKAGFWTNAQFIHWHILTHTSLGLGQHEQCVAGLPWPVLHRAGVGVATYFGYLVWSNFPGYLVFFTPKDANPSNSGLVNNIYIYIYYCIYQSAYHTQRELDKECGFLQLYHSSFNRYILNSWNPHSCTHPSHIILVISISIMYLYINITIIYHHKLVGFTIPMTPELLVESQFLLLESAQKPSHFRHFTAEPRAPAITSTTSRGPPAVGKNGSDEWNVGISNIDRVNECKWKAQTKEH